ncbi:DNA-directed RNA polymerase subunit beta' [Candidatus Dojkabacteria bacterium]|uniref:DNA-directed RNA polymerase subunit beta' n=1 Tax=Candidatus Dojkabacteria bacterium TaxID=2099670 RepID=A0A955L8V9_9BACT|nr:DNA-directed RNA polymerase subunit beta' [Candidatus Dojkabacteria bacterium]
MTRDFKALQISIASPDEILSWSHGEVKKPETINYRTHRSEVDGLMDERIFGPTKNYECYCGKYKKIRYKGIVCDQCGVEVTTKRVRRERMGHIQLACPVTHVWYAYGLPNKLALILDIPQKKLETVIYYARYIVTDFSEEGKEAALETVATKYEQALEDLEADLKQAIEDQEEDLKEKIDALKKEEKDKGKLEMASNTLKNKSTKDLAKVRSIYKQKEENLKEKFDVIKGMVKNMKDGMTISEEEYSQLLEYDIDFFDLGMGAESIRKLLCKIDVEESITQIKEDLGKTRSVTKKRKIIQRLRVFKGMLQANIKPEWVVMDVVPVLPPDLRPIIQLPGGRFATSDLNDLYRRVINRNNRLKRLMKLGAPEIILRNEKRMLQEAVDALIDNSHRPGTKVLNTRDQAYKSLSDMLRGKQGRFRQNLLGKRVDYSARSVIVAGPELGIDQCGLPKTMALELFKPFVLSEIIRNGYAPNIKSAKLVYDSKSAEVWDILEKVTHNHPVMLNRAPTLHKQGIQAFFPVLVEGNAIKLHPMVCKGFNADFDGDQYQMAVHVPLTRKAKEEVIARMFPRTNILLMADGAPVITPDKDMALGIFYLTDVDEDSETTDFVFGSVVQAQGAYDLGEITLHQKVHVLYKGKPRETSVGRLVFNEILPEDYKFVNEQVDKKKVSKISAELFDLYDNTVVIDFLDNIKTLGFKYATQSGISVSFEDFVVSDQKDEILDEVEEKEDAYTNDYYMGLLTWEERRRLVEETWMEAIDKIAEKTWDKYQEHENNLVTLNNSGATPVSNPLRQISGLKGLILDPLGRIVELPLRSNYKDGLSSVEYFVSARGTRKGLADTALKTAESGYLTRRLVDIAQDVIVREEDCGLTEGIWLKRGQNRRLDFGRRVEGRWLIEDVVDEKTGEIVVKKGQFVSKKDGEKVTANENVTKACVASVLTAQTLRGVSQKSYGFDLGTGRPVQKGQAVGIVAAQAMGEAATQLTLDTKHLAGRAGTDITQGLPRVEELFEVRTPKAKAVLTTVPGKVKILTSEEKGTREVVVTSTENTVKVYKVLDGDKPAMKRSKKVNEGDVLLTRASGKEVLSPSKGQATLEDNHINLELDEKLAETFKIKPEVAIIVEDGDMVEKGDKLTDGSCDPKEVLKLKGLRAAQEYIIDQIQETYGIQGIAIDDRHVELIVRQMTRFGKITDAGDSDMLPGDFVDVIGINRENERLTEQGLRTIKYDQQLLGLTTASVRTESFLSAASFQEQVRVLTDAALIGKVDELRGLKENVIIGKPVPLGEEVRL